MMRLDSRSRSTSMRNTPSAIGDRQIFPVQTNRTLFVLLDGFHARIFPYDNCLV